MIQSDPFIPFSWRSLNLSRGDLTIPKWSPAELPGSKFLNSPTFFLRGWGTSARGPFFLLGGGRIPSCAESIIVFGLFWIFVRHDSSCLWCSVKAFVDSVIRTLVFQNPPNTWWVGQEMFGGSNTYSLGIWMSRGSADCCNVRCIFWLDLARYTSGCGTSSKEANCHHQDHCFVGDPH